MRSRLYLTLACVAVAAVCLLCWPRCAGTETWLLDLRYQNSQGDAKEQQHSAQQHQGRIGVGSLQASLEVPPAITTASVAVEQSGPAASLQSPLIPQPDWMSQCCMNQKLRDLYLPGTHDSGTGYPWTTPNHLPFVLDEMAALLFSIMSDLSRTQHDTVYEQLQAGVRVLDLRLAVNPWIAIQQRLEAYGTRSSSTIGRPRASSNRRSLLMRPTESRLDDLALRSISQEHDPSAGAAASAFQIHPDTLQGNINYTAVGGPLSATEVHGAVVISHSLPGVRLVELLADVRRWLAEHPTEVLAILVKGDTVDVNVAASQRMTPTAWAAAADIFREQLQDVQLLTQQQVEQQTLAEIVSDGPQGSVLLYSSDLQQHGHPEALTSAQLEILESWGNGTNTEDMSSLTDRITTWLRFWHDANWKRNQKPYLLLASAEVTLGVKTILQLLKNRIWLLQQQLWQQQYSGSGSLGELHPSDLQHQQDQIPKPQQQQTSKPQGSSTKATQSHMEDSLYPSQLDVYADVSSWLGTMRTLYDMGVAANQQLMREVLINDQVHKTFNIWSLDALSSDIVSVVIQLNTAPATSSTATAKSAANAL